MGGKENKPERKSESESSNSVESGNLPDDNGWDINGWDISDSDEKISADFQQTSFFPPLADESSPADDSQRNTSNIGDSTSVAAVNDTGSRPHSSSKGCLFAVVGALSVLIILGFALLFYVLSLDKELNGDKGLDSAFSANTAASSSALDMSSTETMTTTITTTVSNSESVVADEVTNEDEAVADAENRCAISKFTSIDEPELDIVECDGEWALVMEKGSDVGFVAQWQGGGWVVIPPDSQGQEPPMLPCFSPDFIATHGMPDAIASKKQCDD